MTQSLRQIKNRIRSIENSKKVTNALELVSVAKLNRIEKALQANRPYVKNLESLVHNLTGAMEETTNPFFEKRTRTGRRAVCVITSDSGLCGVYNNNVIRHAEKFLSAGDTANDILVTVGKKGNSFFRRRGFAIRENFSGFGGRYSESVVTGLKDLLIRFFLSGEAGEAYCVYTQFETALVQRPVAEKILPLERKDGFVGRYLYEPDEALLLERLIPRYLAMKFRLMFIEALTSEHAARTVAMKMATDNAKELLHGLLLLRNKVRQARITQDIMEIISSAEALKE